MKTACRLAAFLFVFFVSFSVFAQDYICTTSKKRFYQPGACKNDCQVTREGNGLTRGVTMADKPCSFQPICVGITKHLTAPASGDMYILAYGAVALQKRSAYVQQPEKSILNLVLQRYYHYRIQQFNVRIGEVSGRDQWASLMPSKVGLPTLTVSPDLYLVTPAFLVSVIGHEMVHDQQYKRKNPVDPQGFVSVIDAMRELEASKFQQAIDTFDRGFRMETSVCLEENEAKEIRQVTACREWQVKKAIDDIRLKQHILNNLEKWMMADPWAKQVYIPEHPDWKTAHAGSAPDRTCSPSAPATQQ